MELRAIAKRYLFWFHLFGQCSVVKLEPQIRLNAESISIASILPATLLLAVAISLLTFLVYVQLYISETDNIAIILMLNLIIVTITFRNVIPAIQSFQNRRQFQQIWNEFLALDLIFKRKLLYELNYRVFELVFLKKSALILLVLAASLIPRIVNEILAPSIDHWLERAIMLLSALGLFPLWHAIFYICLVTHLLAMLARHAHTSFNISNVNSVVELLRAYKHIHYHLVTATQLVNQAIGWSWIPICVQSFIEIAYLSYRICWNLISVNFSWTILREYLPFDVVSLDSLSRFF